MRVVPDGERLDHARLAGGLPVDGQERAAVAAAGAGDRRHAGQRAGAGAAGQPEQHRLRLVVAGVAEQHGGRAVPLRDRVQRGVPALARGGFGAGAGPSHLDGDRLDRRQAESGEPVGHVLGPLGGAGLQAVVDRDAAGAQAEAGGLERERGGEGHRVGAAGAGDEDERWRRLGGEIGGEVGGEIGGEGAGGLGGVAASCAPRAPRAVASWALRSCALSTSWSVRRTARRIAATAGWGPMSDSLPRQELRGPRKEASADPGGGVEVGNCCHAVWVDGDRDGLCSPSIARVPRPHGPSEG